jgi:PilZ domain-containing protein
MLAAIPMSNAERRRFPRYDVSRLPGVVDGFRLFETLKIGAGGALIVVAAELPLEQRVQVSIELGDVVFRSAADVVFVGPDLGAPGLFRVGLAFADTVASGDRERLQRFIERSLATGEIR